MVYHGKSGKFPVWPPKMTRRHALVWNGTICSPGDLYAACGVKIGMGPMTKPGSPKKAFHATFVNGHLARRFSPGKDLYGKMLEAVSCPVPEWRWNVPISPIFIQRNPEAMASLRLELFFSKKMAFFQVALLLNSPKWSLTRFQVEAPRRAYSGSGRDGSRRLRSILVPKSRWESWNNDDSSMT